MRLPASEKLEVIRLVEQSHLPARRTLQMLGITPSTFYRWYDRLRSRGWEALEDRPSKPGRVWNRIPDEVRQRIVTMALEQPELSPRELATRFTDTNSYYVSESSVYRLLKLHDLITSRPSLSSRPATSSRTRQPHPTSSGRPTSPTSRSLVGGGTISPPSSMTTRALSSPGSCARRCAPTMSPTRSNWR
jgi:putative transposase